MVKKILQFISQKLKRNRIKVPTILQMEATECGAASLAMLLAYHGLWVPLEKLRQDCGVDRNGSKASSLLKTARKYNCEARGYRWPCNLLSEKDFPLIIHWEFNHFVVLEGIKNNLAYLNDPAVGRRTVPWEEFRTSYTGVALQIIPNSSFRKEGHRYNIFKAVFHKLLDDKWTTLFILLLGLFMIIPGLASPVFQQIFIDDILTKKHPEWMFNLCLAMIGTFLINGIMVWLRATILTYWQRKITLADSSNFFWHVLKLPMQFFQQRYAAEIASRISFNESIASVLSGSAATAVLDIFIAIFYLLLLLQYSVTLTLIGVAFSVINLSIFMFVRRHLTDLSMRIQQDIGKEYGTVMNGLMMIETIKANGNEQDFFAKWAGYRTKVLAGMQEAQLWSISISLLPTLLGGINSALIMTLGGFSIMDGFMTAGIFIAFQHLMDSFQSPFNRIIALGNTLQTTEMQMQRLDDVHRYSIDKLNYPDNPPSEFKTKRLSGQLDISNITFGYNPLEAPLLSDFSLSLKPGHWVAVVGTSGSGKSTLAKIVTGLYEEWSGDILLDGYNRRDIPRNIVINSVASVDQDIFQLSGTVYQNITLFDNSIRRSDVIRAAKDACIHEDIMRLDGGYDYLVTEGGMNFSGGQRQRLEIARALVKNPSLLILDEATSSLDPITEQIVLKNIRQRGCACLIIAHRLSTIRDCDEIIVLSYGKVVERGTHIEMIQHDGPYKQLIKERSEEGAVHDRT